MVAMAPMCKPLREKLTGRPSCAILMMYPFSGAEGAVHEYVHCSTGIDEKLREKKELNENRVLQKGEVKIIYAHRVLTLHMYVHRYMYILYIYCLQLQVGRASLHTPSAVQLILRAPLSAYPSSQPKVTSEPYMWWPSGTETLIPDILSCTNM